MLRLPVRATTFIVLGIAACGAPRTSTSAKVVEVGAMPDAAAPSIEGSSASGSAGDRRRPTRLALELALCAVMGDGSVRCIGSLGVDDLNWKKKGSYPIEGVPPVVEIALGRTHACARTLHGEVWCWGKHRPDLLRGLSNVARIVAGGSDFTCALTRDGRVSCWGLADPTPAPVSGATDIVDIAMWDSNVCATTADGHVVCWTDREQTPHAETADGHDTSKLSEIADVAIAGYAACARRRDGRVMTSELRCGRQNDGDGGLVNGMVAISVFGEPGWTEMKNGNWVLVPGVTSASAVAAGIFSGCAVGGDGKVRCWGCAGFLESKGVAEPTVIPGLDDAEELVVDATSVCARKRDDSVWCRGSNVAGSSAETSRVRL